MKQPFQYNDVNYAACMKSHEGTTLADTSAHRLFQHSTCRPLKMKKQLTEKQKQTNSLYLAAKLNLCTGDAAGC